MASDAVHHGDDHKPKSSLREEDEDEESDRKPLVPQRPWPVEPRTKQSTRGIAHQHKRTCQAKEVTSTKQHEDQRSPEVDPGVHGRTFFGANVGPSSPCRIITTATTSNGICRTVRECCQRRKRPMNGTRSRSKRGASTDNSAGLEDWVPTELD